MSGRVGPLPVPSLMMVVLLAWGATTACDDHGRNAAEPSPSPVPSSAGATALETLLTPPPSYETIALAGTGPISTETDVRRVFSDDTRLADQVLAVGFRRGFLQCWKVLRTPSAGTTIGTIEQIYAPQACGLLLEFDEAESVEAVQHTLLERASSAGRQPFQVPGTLQDGAGSYDPAGGGHALPHDYSVLWRHGTFLVEVCYSYREAPASPDEVIDAALAQERALSS